MPLLRVFNRHSEQKNYIRAALLLVLLILAGYYSNQFFEKLRQLTPEISIDAEISNTHGGAVEVYANHETHISYRSPIQHPGRTQYKLTLPFYLHNITAIRLDPAEEPHARIKIYGITFSQAGNPVVRVSPQELNTWQKVNNTTTLSPDQSYLLVESTTNDPMLITTALSVPSPMKMLIGFSLPSLEKISDALTLSKNRIILWSWIGAGIFLLIFRRQSSVFSFYLLFTIGLNIYPLLRKFLFPKIAGNVFPIHEAVGVSSFLYYPKTKEYNIFWLTLGFFMIGGMIARIIRGKYTSYQDAPALQPGSKLFLVFWIACFAMMTVPPIQATFDSLPNVVHSLDYDSMNILSWQFYHFKGWLPLKDFWYPYGGWLRLSAPFPWELFRFYIHDLALFSFLLINVYLLCNRRKIATFFVFVALAILFKINYFYTLYRYTIALDIVLFYLAIQRIRTGKLLGYGILGFLMGWAFVMEVNQVLYAGVTLLAQFTIYLYGYRSDRSKLKELIRGMIATGCTFSSVALFYLAWLYKDGQLPGFIDFYRVGPAMAYYSAIPSGLLSWFSLSFTQEHVILQLILLLGLLAGFWICRSPKSRSGDIALSVALLTALVMQKQIMRHHAAPQFILFPILGLLVLFANWLFSPGRSKFAFQLLALIMITGISSGLKLQDTALEYFRNYKLIPGAVEVLSKSSEDLERQKQLFFAPERFKLAGQSGVDIARSLKDLFPHENLPKFFVLGDDAFFYILFEQKPPPYISLYNMSPVSAQNETLHWLKSEDPGVIIWNPDLKSFDGFSIIARVPTLFSYVVQNYEPWKKLGKFEILRKRQAGSPIRIDFWLSNLGNQLDLGAIPALSILKDRAIPCPSLNDSKNCRPFIKLSVPSHLNRGQIDLPLQFGKSEFHVKFTGGLTEGTYYLDLDRLWFWALHSTIKDRETELKTKSVEIKTEFKKFEVSDSVLY